MTDAADASPGSEHRLLFVGGLHKSGTSLLARCLGEHPRISRFAHTGVPEDEGQHLQSLYPPASAFGGPGRFGFHPEAHLTEASPLVTAEARRRLMAEWSPYWDLSRDVLLEKSPPNLIRTRFLQGLFPDACFVMIVRHPVAVAYATQRWSRTGLDSLIEHWAVCHEIFAGDRPHLRRVHVVRYEDLVERPQATLDAVCAFLGLEPHRCGLEVRPALNAAHLQRWSEDAASSSPAGLAARAYAARVLPFGYEM